MASLRNKLFLSLTDTVLALDGQIRGQPNLVDLIYDEGDWIRESFFDSEDGRGRAGRTYLKHSRDVGAIKLQFVRSRESRGWMPSRATLHVTVGEPAMSGAIEHLLWIQGGPRARGIILQREGFRIPLYGYPYPFYLPAKHIYDWNNFFGNYSGKRRKNPNTMLTGRGMSQIFCAIMIMIAWTDDVDRTETLPTREETGVRIAEMTKCTAERGGYGD